MVTPSSEPRAGDYCCVGRVRHGGGVREIRGDLWVLADASPDTWVIVPTNGVVRANGHLVMGAGVAASAAARHPQLAGALGAHVREHGNTPVAVPAARVLSWPTKPDVHELNGRSHPGWMCAARVRSPECTRAVASLVWANVPLVVAAADEAGITGDVLLPHVGCGLGGLDWAQVGPALHRVLDDRFVAVTPA